MEIKIAPKAQQSRSYGNTKERPVILKADNLVKIYGKRTVVDGVSFEVRESEVVGLLGSNGAGKTTSFRMACGLIQPNGGTVTLNGLNVTNWPMYRRAREGELGYLPQDRSTFGALTTEENLIGAMQFLGYTKAQQREKLDELLVKFKLTHIRKTKVGYGGSGGLSGGERRRLEIARALLSHPKILLLDEPFANVDPITVDEMQKVILELVKDSVSILITDHQVAETLAITDRSYIVNRGKVLCSGSPVEVLMNQRAIDTYFGKNAANLLRQFQAGELNRRTSSPAPSPVKTPNEQNSEAFEVEDRASFSSTRSNNAGRSIAPSSQDPSNSADAVPTQHPTLPFLSRRRAAGSRNPTEKQAEEPVSTKALAGDAAVQRPEPTALPDTKAEEPRQVDVQNVPELTPRRSLGLKRREPGVVKQTPAPKIDSTPSRFENKIRGLFQRKKK